MTNKEALEKICLHCEYYHQDMCYRAIAGCKEWHKLEKDLEVLEILKNKSDNKTIIIKDGIATFHIDMVLDCDTYPCIKEWLGDKAHIIER